jgi:hypothetical protein
VITTDRVHKSGRLTESTRVDSVGRYSGESIASNYLQESVGLLFLHLATGCN